MATRSSTRHKLKMAQYEPKPLELLYKNHLGSSTSFKNQSSYMKEAAKDSPHLMALHNQKNNPYCALFSIVTAVEIARNKRFSKEENSERHGFCLNTGKQAGMRLMDSLKMYKSLFPQDMTYETAFNENSSDQYSSKNGIGKDYGNANDLVHGLQKNVCVVTMSCADVDSQYRIHERKQCRANDYHAITCVAFVLINKKPTFVFKDTNNRPKNKYNFVFLDADEFTDGQLLLEKAVGGIWHRVGEATAETRKKIFKENLLVMEEIYIITALHREENPEKMQYIPKAATIVKPPPPPPTPILLMNQLNLKSVYNINGLSKIDRYIKANKTEIDEMVELINRTRGRPKRDIEQLNQQTYLRGPRVQDDFSKTLENALNASVCVESNGSGSIVMLNNKPHVLTNAHVASRVGQLKFVMWRTGDYGVAETVYMDEKDDVAFMEIVKRPPGIIYSMPISKATPKKGQRVVQVHNPYHWYDEVVGKKIVRREEDGRYPFSAEVRKFTDVSFPRRLVHEEINELTNVDDGSSGSPLFTVNKFGKVGGIIAIHKEFNSDTNEFVAQGDLSSHVAQFLKTYMNFKF